MDTADYWPMACKYAIWNAAIASLQFWAEYLNQVTLGIASQCVYTTFFWTPTSHTLCQLPEDVLFGCFVIALNAVFTHQLSLADEGYESGSDTNDLPMPLWKTPCILHVSNMDHASFHPVHTTPRSTATNTHCSTATTTPCSTATTTHCSTATTTHRSTVTTMPRSIPQTPDRPVCHCLSFSSDTDHTPDSTPACSNSSDAEEDFPMVPLEDEHWTLEIVPERTICIHKDGLPNNLCQYPCPYGSNNTVSYMDTLDLSDILDYEDYMVTSSDEELPGMEEVPY